MIPGRTRVERNKTDRQLAFHLVIDADHGALGDVRVPSQNFLHAAGRQAMAGDIDDVVRPRHDVGVAVVIDVSRVGGFVVTRKLGKVGFDETLVRPPERRKRAGRQRQLHNQSADFTGLGWLRIRVDNSHVPAGYRFRGRAMLDRKLLDPQAVGANRPAGFGLPPVVDHRYAEMFFRPLQSSGVGSLTRQKQRLQPGEIEVLYQLALGIFPLDGTESSRRGEKNFDVVL